MDNDVLIVVDMTNDFVHDEYEYEGETYKGKLVAPRGKEIIEPIRKLLEQVYKNGRGIVWKVAKDHFNAFDDDSTTLHTLLDKNVYMVGLVDEVCIFQNAMALNKMGLGFNVHIVRGHTVLFVEEKGKEVFAMMADAGIKFVDSMPDTVRSVIFLEDEHDESTEEISDTPDFVNTFPEHCMKGTPGAETVSELHIGILKLTER